jgi:hypothetical protein
MRKMIEYFFFLGCSKLFNSLSSGFTLLAKVVISLDRVPNCTLLTFQHYLPSNIGVVLAVGCDSIRGLTWPSIRDNMFLE